MIVRTRHPLCARLALGLVLTLVVLSARAAATHGCSLGAGGCGLGSCVVPGCSQPKGPSGGCLQIDPTGDHIFKPHPPHYHNEPHPWHEHHSPSGVVIWPRRVVAPVNSEVVLLAGICGKDGHLRANENVEWIMAPGGVGHFLGIGQRSWLHSLSLLGEAPKKIDNTYATGVTMGRYVNLTRGTPMVEDDIKVQKGQTWVTASSPVEGTSYVTVFGPEVYGWDRRQQTAEIYWVDAQWQFPPAAVNPVGTRHAFTTVVTKYSDRAPVIGWRVRYEITGGPEAGFAPDGAKVVEIPTNELGQATAEIFQPVPMAGTNVVSIQVIRPADSATGNQRMVMGTGTTSKTWSSPDIALQKTGPAQAAIGALATYRLEIRNPGGASVRDVVVIDQIPPGMTHVSSNPPATVQAARLEWRLGELLGGQTATIEFNVRVDQAGTFNNCASLTTAEGLTAQDCVSTTVMASVLDVRVTAPPSVSVGQDVPFLISITNSGNAPATGLRVKSTFDAGLQHATYPSPLENGLQSLEPGQTQQITINLKAVQAGQLCNTVEVLSPTAILGSARACVTAAQSGGAPVTPGQPSVPGQASIQVEKTGPSALRVGEKAEFNIIITNNGQTTVNDLKITDNYDVALDPVQATDGYAFVGDDLVWRIDTLAPGRRVLLQIHCQCQQPIARACNRITVTTREGARADAEACLEIRPATGAPPSGAGAGATPQGAANLTLTIADRRDPVTAGRELVYEVRITNRGTTAARKLSLRADASNDLLPIAIGTSGPSKATISQQRVQFAEVDSLEPGSSLLYLVGVRAQRPGTGRVSVQVSTLGASAPVTAEESTTIIPEQ